MKQQMSMARMREIMEQRERRAEQNRQARNRKKAEAGRKKIEGLPLERRIEAERRDIVRMLRREAANAGYAGTVRLSYDAGAYHVSIDEVSGIKASKFAARVQRREEGDHRDELLQRTLEMTDLSDVATRRNYAIRQAGGKTDSPPAWAFVGHPVMRGVIAALKPDPRDFRPLDKVEWQDGVRLSAKCHDMRLGYAGVRIRHNGMDISIDAGNQMARIRLGGKWPETIVDSLKGRPLAEVMGLPGLEPGTKHGDTPVQKGWQDDSAMGFTVECGYVPLADAPEGVDTSWLAEWMERHLC